MALRPSLKEVAGSRRLGKVTSFPRWIDVVFPQMHTVAVAAAQNRVGHQRVLGCCSMIFFGRAA